MKTVAVLIGTISILYVLVALLLYLFQNNLVFLPSSNIVQSPDSVGLIYDDIFVQSTDGNKIHGWWVEQNEPLNAITILICHGNAGNISGRIFLMEMFYKAGYNVMLFDYQGYGRSEGRPSEQAIYDDGLAMWDFLINEKGVHPQNLIPLGRSMGGAVALKIAEKRNPSAIILLSTFTTVPDVASRVYPIFPVRRLARIQMDNLARISNFMNPVFIAHSPNDELIPFDMKQRLTESSGGETTLYRLSGGHNDTASLTNPNFMEAVDRFIEGVVYK